MSASEEWYVIKQPNGRCHILTTREWAATPSPAQAEEPEKWGPFASQAEAIARRVGLIRAGKCQPQ